MPSKRLKIKDLEVCG